MASEEAHTIGHSSHLQTDILRCLNGEPKSLGDLRKTVNARDTSILHAIRELESERLVQRDNISHVYSLTSIGHAHAVILDKTSKASKVLREKQDFWLQHDISAIPERLLTEVWALDKASVISNAPTDLTAVHEKYLELLKVSKRVHGVSPIFHPDFAEVMAQILSKGAEISLIVTKEVLNQVKEGAKLMDLAKYAKRIVVDRSLDIRVREGLKVAVTVSEHFLSLGLFKLDGTYDYSVDLMSTDPEALEWGERLYEHFRGSSESVKLSSML